MLHFILHVFFPFLKLVIYIWCEKLMIIGRSRREVNDAMYVCIRVFGLRLFAFDLLFFLSLFFFFRKTARIQAHHMCYRRAHPFFSSSSSLFSAWHVSIITPILHVDVCVRRKKTNRERERERKTQRNWVLNVYNEEEEEKNVALTSFSFLL